jgi:CBS domain-containing protein
MHRRRLMTPNPITIGADSNMQTAIELMAQHKITLLVVVDATHRRRRAENGCNSST